MKRLIVLSALVLLSGGPALADMDVEMEKREAAQQEAARRAAEAKQLEMQRQRQDAQRKADAAISQHMMDSKRNALGAAASGKSDAEVDRLYEARTKSDAENAARAMDASRKALSQGQGADALQGVTGKSLHELENMTDAEAEALARELEKKYGD